MPLYFINRHELVWSFWYILLTQSFDDIIILTSYACRSSRSYRTIAQCVALNWAKLDLNVSIFKRRSVSESMNHRHRLTGNRFFYQNGKIMWKCVQNALKIWCRSCSPTMVFRKRWVFVNLFHLHERIGNFRLFSKNVSGQTTKTHKMKTI